MQNIIILVFIASASELIYVPSDSLPNVAILSRIWANYG